MAEYRVTGIIRNEATPKSSSLTFGGCYIWCYACLDMQAALVSEFRHEFDSDESYLLFCVVRA